MSTRFLTAGEFAALDKWYVIDATDQILGRVATKVATILSGKHRPQYAPFLVSGDHVIIINAEKIKLTGEKLDKKVYRWHTRYPGGLREIGARKVFETRPDRVIREAVLGMLPKNKLRKRLVKRLKVYLAEQHPHAAQQPECMCFTHMRIASTAQRRMTDAQKLHECALNASGSWSRRPARSKFPAAWHAARGRR